VTVLVHDRRRWHVVDPSLTPAEAAEAVAELRRAAAPTNVGRVRRVLRWTPLLVFLVTAAAGFAAVVVGVEALPLTEELGETSLGVVGLLVVLVGAIALALAVAHRVAPDLDDPERSAGVVEVPRHVRAWLTDETPVAAVWRVAAAVGLVDEFRDARWGVADLAEHGPDDTTDVDDRGAGVDRRAVAVLLAAEASAVAELAAAAADAGYVPSRSHRQVGR
jgi:hypothetical protein